MKGLGLVAVVSECLPLALCRLSKTGRGLTLELLRVTGFCRLVSSCILLTELLVVWPSFYFLLRRKVLGSLN